MAIYASFIGSKYEKKIAWSNTSMQVLNADGDSDVFTASIAEANSVLGKESLRDSVLLASDQLATCMAHPNGSIVNGQRAVGTNQTEAGILDIAHLHYINRRNVE
jgi:hypothetical protein